MPCALALDCKRYPSWCSLLGVTPRRSASGRSGHPVATLALYGPTNMLAAKLVVGIVQVEDADHEPFGRWFAQAGDIRNDAAVMQQALQFVRRHAVKSVMRTDRFIGCPQSEGIDFLEGEACPRRPFWASRDRWA
jgi:hypothetical protein